MKRRTLLTSVLVIVLCLGLIAGSTYALFTSESKVNIAVTSGKVSIVASLKDLTIYSAYSADATLPSGNPVDKIDPTDTTGTLTGTFAGTYYYKELTGTTFTNGGTAKLSDNDQLLTLSKVTPGDKVALKVQIDNDSNVKIKYRVRVNVLEENDEASSIKLFNGLVTKIDGTVLDGVIRVTNWTSVEANNNNIADIPVEIYLPIDAGNEYQDKVTKISILVEAVQDNAATRTELEAINGYLATLPTKNPTMYDAINSLVGANIAGLETLATYDDAFAKVMDCLWNVDTDRFYVESDEEGFGYQYFKAYTYKEFDELTTPKYSIYAYDAVGTGTPWAGLDVTVKVGFDAGVTSGITSITYDRCAATYGQEVVIRTNSFGTTLTVNAPLDTIHHYDKAGALNIIAVANSSYHEFGAVAYANISKGHIAVEKDALISNLHINAKVENNVKTDTFDEIYVSLAENTTKPTFSRDNIDINTIDNTTGGTLVVAIQDGSTSAISDDSELDYIWLTKQGIFEQIKVSDNKDTANNGVWADDNSFNNTNTQEASLEIANNIGRVDANNKKSAISVQVQIDSTDTYQVKLDANRDLVVVKSTDVDTPVASISQDGTVDVNDKTYTISLDKNTDTKETELVATNVLDQTDTSKATAIQPSGKEAATSTQIEEMIAETISDLGYVVRIANNYYKSFNEGFAAAASGDTMYIIGDCSAPNHAPNAYDASGMNLNIYVEAGVTLNCGNVTNGKFNIGWNNAIGTLTLEGPGKITLDTNSTWGLVTQNGSGNAITVVVKDVTIEASSAGGKIMSHDTGNLTVESGHYKNITFKAGQIKKGYKAELNTDTDYYDIVVAPPADAVFLATPNDPSIPSEYITPAQIEDWYLQTAPAFKNGNYTLKLLNDHTIDTIHEWIYDDFRGIIIKGDNIVIDLNGKTLSYIGSSYNLFDGAGNIQPHNLTIKNGTLIATGNYYANIDVNTLTLDNVSMALHYGNGNATFNGYYDAERYFYIDCTEPTQVYAYTAFMATVYDYKVSGECEYEYSVKVTIGGQNIFCKGSKALYNFSGEILGGDFRFNNSAAGIYVYSPQDYKGTSNTQTYNLALMQNGTINLYLNQNSGTIKVGGPANSTYAKTISDNGSSSVSFYSKNFYTISSTGTHTLVIS